MYFSLNYWIGFFLFVIVALAVDIGFFHRKPRILSAKEAFTMTSLWFLAASIFSIIIYFQSTRQKALEFITGYLIELSLSMDNVFVFILIFSFFKIPMTMQHRVLFWGVIGAIVMRLAMILGGIKLFESFEWIFYIFGAFLIYSGLKIAITKPNEAIALHDNKFINWLKRKLKVTTLQDDRFFIRKNNNWHCTPLFLALLLIEQSDLIFALDSIPAILAISRDPFIVFTSNIFAILGLRSLYFLVADLIDRFAYMKFGIGIVLSFVGFKMIASMLELHIPTGISLLVILTVLAASVFISLYSVGVNNFLVYAF